MRLVLHIGTEKTGTTLLQRWLYDNSAELSRQGVYLSGLMAKPNNRDFAAFFQTRFDGYFRRLGIATAGDRDRHFDGFLDAVSSEITQAAETHHTMVITSEHFHSQVREVGKLAELKAFTDRHFAEVRVLCYLREQSELRKSLYSTACRVAETADIGEFHEDAGAASHYYNYHLFLGKWAGVFGRKALDVRIYDRARFPSGDIPLDFLDRAFPDVAADSLSFEVSEANERLAYLRARAFRGVNRAVPLFLPEGGVDPLNRALKSALAGATRLDRGEITDPRQPAFHAVFRKSNRELSEAYFDGEPLFEPPPSAVADHDSGPVFTLAEVGDIVEELVEILALARPDERDGER